MIPVEQAIEGHHRLIGKLVELISSTWWGTGRLGVIIKVEMAKHSSGYIYEVVLYPLPGNVRKREFSARISTLKIGEFNIL